MSKIKIVLKLKQSLMLEARFVVPRRSNRRPDGAQLWKQHSDWALSLMLLGDFEIAGFASSKRRHSVPATSGRRLRSLARQENIIPNY
ncbi:hypothetical protein AAW28_08785 [Lacticaseibacillus casei]|nr:hypothetical protein AAW28_08785 [Lacticaseibacillus casei]